jgi:hypothetical protein
MFAMVCTTWRACANSAAGTLPPREALKPVGSRAWGAMILAGCLPWQDVFLQPEEWGEGDGAAAENTSQAHLGGMRSRD